MARDILIRRWWWQRGKAITLSLANTPAPSVRAALLVQRKIVATMVSRAAREVGLHAGVTAETPIGSVRAAQLQRLRAERIWDHVPPPIQTMLAAPEGSWTTETTGRVLVHLEVIAVLNWALHPRRELPSLSPGGTADASLLREALTGKSTNDTFLRTETEIDQQELTTRVYLTQLQNILAQRGATEGAEAHNHINQYSNRPVDDLPLRGAPLRDAQTADLLHLRGVAAVRMITLEGLRDVVTGLGMGRMEAVIENLKDDA